MSGIDPCVIRDLIYILNTSDKSVLTKTIVNSNNLGKLLTKTYNCSWEFSHGIDGASSVTNQKRSGRCWIFSGMNCLRHKLCNKLNIDNFEFSYCYIQFFDKIEKAHHFLNIMEHLKCEDIESSLVRHFLSDDNICSDGGTWNMFLELVKKYGMIPKYAMIETYQSSNTWHMNDQIKKVLRKAAFQIRSENANIKNIKGKALINVVKILNACIGSPPNDFEFSYSNKDKEFINKGKLTPISFYQRFCCDLNPTIVCCNCPNLLMNKRYFVEMQDPIGRGYYYNLEIDKIANGAIQQIKNGYPVWFASETTMMDDENGIMEVDLQDGDLIFDIETKMSKADQLNYGGNKVKHAMTLVGVNLRDGNIMEWKVENSWGEDNGVKGYYTMSHRWFCEYVYEVVIFTEYLDSCDINKMNTVALKPWSVLGSVA